VSREIFFFFKILQRVKSLSETFPGGVAGFSPQNKPISGFSTGRHLKHCKRKLGTIWNLKLRSLIPAYSQRFSPPSTSPQRALLRREEQLLLRFSGGWLPG